MHCTQKVTNDLYYVGSSDRRLALFESVYPIPRGVSYNSYVLLDDKTVLLDTVDRAVGQVFFENVDYVLNGRKLDYVIVNHMEPDHAATLAELVLRHPEVTIVTNAKAVAMVKQFFEFDPDKMTHLVKEGDVLKTGKHELTFVMAPMVHWPEVMVTYDITDKILFSADAFGTFGALSGNIFADEVNFEQQYLDEARRYYTNIVGKYGTQVSALLNKASGLDISMICPLHGPIWRKNIPYIVDKYVKWATYTPEDKAVMVAYASVYGDTENAANILAAKLADKGIKNIVTYDVSTVHSSVIVSEAFRCSHLVFASTTYNAGIFINMEEALLDIQAHNLQNRTVAFIENGSWAATSGNKMKEIFSTLKGTKFIEAKASLKSSVKEANLAQLDEIADAIAADFVCPCSVATAEKEEKKGIDKTALFNISYGLFVLSTNNGKDNGCIINTLTQVAEDPLTVTIAVNKKNFSNEAIQKTGKFNVSILTEKTDFSVFKRFGFASGKDTDKFAGFENVARAENGILYLTEACTMVSACVKQTVDLGSHYLYIADVTEAVKLADEKPCTYSYYLTHIKPQPVVTEKKTGWVCQICGYVYEGEELPDDFECPLCKHGKEVMKKL
ncbi:MAG: flavin reductase [Sphaerochaetaceae bacterium]|nr:flavin reductase [Sphaerochaetaceae bacterium]